MTNLNSTQLLLLQQLGIKPLQPKQGFFATSEMALPLAGERLSGQLLADLESCLTLTSLQGYRIAAQQNAFSVQQQQLLLDPQFQFTPQQKRALWTLLGKYIND
jgi:hypothetical protein